MLAEIGDLHGPDIFKTETYGWVDYLIQVDPNQPGFRWQVLRSFLEANGVKVVGNKRMSQLEALHWHTVSAEDKVFSWMDPVGDKPGVNLVFKKTDKGIRLEAGLSASPGFEDDIARLIRISTNYEGYSPGGATYLDRVNVVTLYGSERSQGRSIGIIGDRLSKKHGTSFTRFRMSLKFTNGHLAGNSRLMTSDHWDYSPSVEQLTFERPWR